MSIRLGVNIDHVATLRNARGEFHPDPVLAAKFVKKKGADSITIHLREDRRKIKDLDAKKIAHIADGVVVGSAIVDLIDKGKPIEEIKNYIKSLANSVHGV